MILKKYFLKIVTVAAMAAGFLASCTQDFGSDLSELQQKVEELEGTVKDIQTAIGQGVVVTDVEPVDGGVKITLSDEREFTIVNGKDGLDGEDGKDGKDGTVWKIGDNGNWWSSTNGEPFVDTEKPARGPQGLPGLDGKDGLNGKDGLDGQDGEDGKDGDYFYPCTDKASANYGKWIKVNGETGAETPTDDEWLPEGTVTAVWGNETLTLHNVEGADNGVVSINITRVLKSLAVLRLKEQPYSISLGCPYTFAYAILTEVEEAEVVKSREIEDIPVSMFTLKYRVNPEGADISEYEFHMLDVTAAVTKATGDNRDNIVPKITATYDGKDEITVKGYIDYVKYWNAFATEETLRKRGGFETAAAYFLLEASKDGKGKQAVVSDYASVRMDYVLPYWTAYSRYNPDITVENWNPAPCEANGWYAKVLMVDGVEKVRYPENDALVVSETYDVASRMRFADDWFGALETLGFDVRYTYEVFNGEDGAGLGASDMIECTADGKVSVKEEYRSGEGLAGAIGQYAMVTAKAEVLNGVTGKWFNAGEAQYIFLIVPDSTEAVNVTYDLGKFNYSKLSPNSENRYPVPVDVALEALSMNMEGFTNIYTRDPEVTSTLPTGFKYTFKFGEENVFDIDLTPLIKIGKDEVIFSFVPKSEEYPVLNYTVKYEIVFDIVPPILNPDYVLYDDEAKTILTETVIKPDPQVDSLVSVKGKEVDGTFALQSSIREHILDYGQYLAPANPNIASLSMRINFEKSNKPEDSAEIFSNGSTNLYQFQEIRLTSPFTSNEEFRDYVVDMNITLRNGDEYMIKEYIVRFIKPFRIVANDIVLETHKKDICEAQATYQIVERDGTVLYDSATDELSPNAVYHYPGIFDDKVGAPKWTLIADDSFGDNLYNDETTGMFYWANDGTDLQVNKYAKYEVTQEFPIIGVLSGIGNITVLKTADSHASHGDHAPIIEEPIIIIEDPIEWPVVK